MKKFIRTFVFGCVCVAAGYLILQAFSILYRPYQVQTAVAFTMADTVLANGVVVRDEVAIEPVNGVLGYTVQDGIRVYQGKTVAEVFATSVTAQNRLQAQFLQTEIEALHTAQSYGETSGNNVDAVLKQVQANTYEILSVLADGNYKNLETVKAQLTLAENKLQIATGAATDYASRIDTLVALRDSAAADSTAINTVSAPATGFFVTQADGLEQVFTQETVSQLTPSELQGMITGTPQLDLDNSGKIVTSYKWHYYALVTQKQASQFQTAMDKGAKVTVTFNNSTVESLPAEIVGVTLDDTADLCTIDLLFDYTSADLFKLRFEPVTIAFKSYTGIRVDKSALHIQDGQYGVYIKYGTTAYFKRITPILENEEYLLLPLQQIATEDNEVVLYDEVIVKGVDLYDGKLL
ncbi:MAG: HlyD family efflux transporter periplasmic adaptor subunit [Oscillospiraceae bacterium]|nr:HlyD family efflux transporter periplasmic adaptor subunit [Oscillospiraceae bacterium]